MKDFENELKLRVLICISHPISISNKMNRIHFMVDIRFHQFNSIYVVTLFKTTSNVTPCLNDMEPYTLLNHKIKLCPSNLKWRPSYCIV